MPPRAGPRSDGTLLALIGPAAIALAVLVSIGPAVSAMRVHPAATLHQE